MHSVLFWWALGAFACVSLRFALIAWAKPTSKDIKKIPERYGMSALSLLVFGIVVDVVAWPVCLPIYFIWWRRMSKGLPLHGDGR